MKAETAYAIHESMGVILSRKLMDCLDRIEELSTLQTTNEFRVLELLQRTVPEADCLVGEPAPNVSFEIVVGLWSQFSDEVNALNDTYKAFLDSVARRFKLNVPHPIFLFGSIVKHEKKIRDKLDVNLRPLLKEYVIGADEIIKRFKVGLLNYQAADSVDRFLDNSEPFEKSDVRFLPAVLGVPTIYLDLNAVAFILSKANIKRQCVAASQANKIAFVYSSFTLEDIVLSNPLFVSDLIEALQELARDHLVGILSQEVAFVTEDIYHTYERVELLRPGTRNFEHYNLVSTVRHYHDYPAFRRGEKVYNIIVDDPMALFGKDSLHRTIPEMEFLTLEFRDEQFVQALLRTGEVTLATPADSCEAIEQLLKLCDFINFQTEVVKMDNASKISSSYRDNKHILHASITDYLISDDEKLRARAKFVYGVLGITTEVMTSKVFLQRSKEILAGLAAG
ncbi:hypothetical protein [Pseudomonas sp. B22129]|uniref:hypothetical protein n=1 Tax=Pseudomonas sp. B22129 TaxID=3235111 RepID=UPI003784EDF8